MGKLSNLKEWLTAADAGRNLSIVLGEEVSEADVLRLGLDGRLQLSVNFVNNAQARCGKVVTWEHTDWRLYPSVAKLEGDSATESKNPKVIQCPLKLAALYNEIPDDQRKNFSPELRSIDIDGTRFLTLDDDVTTLRGIWDLPMIGNERLDIERQYQILTGGPTVKLFSLGGAFVEGRDGLMCQLQATLDEFEIPEIPLGGSKDQFTEFLDKVNHLPKASYFPADGLPDGSVIVVRTAALREFVRQMNGDPLPASRAHVSDKLARLNQAAAKFWGNADRDDRGTHPDNADVAAWLVQQNFSQSLADKAATIIRPEWAPTGRKPEE